MLQSSLHYKQADCKIFKMRDLQVYVHSEIFAKDKAMHEYDGDESWIYPPPNSTGDMVLKEVCE